MKRITTFVVAAMLSIAGCDSDAETESATSRTIELADSIDGMLATLGGHMTDVLAADGELEIRALETLQWERTEVALHRIAFWIESLEECVDDEGEPPHTAVLYAMYDEAELTAIGHILGALFADDVIEIARDAELRYQILMTNQMSALRASPLYGEAMSELYTCPVLLDHKPDVPAMPAMERAPAAATCAPGARGDVCAPITGVETAPLTDCDPGTQGRSCRAIRDAAVYVTD